MTPGSGTPSSPALPPASAVPLAPARPAMTRGDRVRDAVAMALVVLGVVLILIAHGGDTRLATHPVIVAKGQSAFAQWMHYYYFEMAGYAAVMVGVITGIVSYAVRARRLRRSASRTPGA